MVHTHTITAIHGAGLHSAVWGGLAALLQGWNVHALTLPGHNPLKHDASFPAVLDMAGWLAGRLGDGQRHVLLGHSMGALVALEAARHPAVAGVVLMGVAEKMPVNPDLLHKARTNPAAAIDLILKWGVNAAQPQAAAVRAALKTIMQAETSTLVRDLAACDAYGGAAAAARPLDKPALVIAGAEDRMVRAKDSQALAALFKNGSFATVPGAGHMMMSEDPAGCAAAMTGFLSGISRG